MPIVKSIILKADSPSNQQRAVRAHSDTPTKIKQLTGIFFISDISINMMTAKHNNTLTLDV